MNDIPSRKNGPRFRITKVPLPYIDNAWTVSATLFLNALLTWIFGLQRYGVRDIVIDAVICALLTTAIDVLVVWKLIKRARSRGMLPKEIPVRRWVMFLPKNLPGLIAVLGLFFAVLCVGVNYTIFTWYGFESWTFHQFLVYKLVYSLILSERIVSLCILRFVQPDCESKEDGPKTETPVDQAVKNPIPSLSGMKELFSSISTNLALQLYFNPHLGEYAADGPRSIVVEGVVVSVITSFIVVILVAKTMDLARANGELQKPPETASDRFFRRLPRNRWLFALLCAIVTGAAGGGLFLFLFRIYGFTSWTFYEFFWVKIAWMTILGKILVNLSIRRFVRSNLAGRTV